jgi:hypothetical protein
MATFTIRSNLRIPEATAKFQGGALRAVRVGAEVLLWKSKNHVPHRKGMLENSGSVDSDNSNPNNPVASTFYDTPYAVKLHEHPEYKFKGKGRGKWLQDAKNEAGSVILAEMAKTLREAMK